MAVIDLLNSNKMEENYLANRKLLKHLGFRRDIDNHYRNFKLKIDVHTQTLFLDPVVFFDGIHERIDFIKTKMEIKEL